MSKYTLSDVKASYEQKRDWEKQFPVSRFIFRPLSFPLAAFMLRFTESPAAVAWFGLAIGLAASWMLVDLRSVGLWPGIAGLALFALLDATDGNIARTTKSVTLYGKMLDGLLGRLAEGIYMPALACGLYLAYGPGGPLSGTFRGPQVSWLLPAAGFTALCASLYASGLETAFDLYSLQKARPASATDVNARIGSSRFRDNPLYLVFINLNAFNVQVLLLAGAAATGPLWVVRLVYALAAYYLLRLAVVFCYYVRRASQELK